MKEDIISSQFKLPFKLKVDKSISHLQDDIYYYSKSIVDNLCCRLIEDNHLNIENLNERFNYHIDQLGFKHHTFSDENNLSFIYNKYVWVIIPKLPIIRSLTIKKLLKNHE